MLLLLRGVLFSAGAYCTVVFLSACSGAGGGTAPNTVLPPASSGSPAPGSHTGTPAVNITEFPVVGDTSPEAITVAPDGNPWFLTQNHVDRITSTGTITPFTAPPADAILSYSPANDITIGPESAVWFSANGSALGSPSPCAAVALLRIVPNAAPGTFAQYVACPGNREHGEMFQAGIVSGANGNLWMVDQNATGLGEDGSQYQEIQTNGTILFSRNLPEPCLEFASFDKYIATGIQRGSDGALYVAAGSPCGPGTTHSTSNAVIRIDATGTVTNIFYVPDAVRITSGPDGNLWVTQDEPTNGIARITPRGSITEFPIPTPHSHPLGITAGNDGAVWFTETATSKIGRITADGKITEFPTPTPNSTPFGIASLAGACGPGHGLIWFTEQTGNKIGKIQF